MHCVGESADLLCVLRCSGMFLPPGGSVLHVSFPLVFLRFDIFILNSLMHLELTCLRDGERGPNMGFLFSYVAAQRPQAPAVARPPSPPAREVSFVPHEMLASVWAVSRSVDLSVPALTSRWPRGTPVDIFGIRRDARKR